MAREYVSNLSRNSKSNCQWLYPFSLWDHYSDKYQHELDTYKEKWHRATGLLILSK